MKKIFETLIYTDGGGKRRLRDYVKVALIILVLIIGVIAVGVNNHYQMVSEIMAEPRPLDASLIATPTEQVAEPVSQIEECPSNPAYWTLTENVSVPGSNLKELTPQCVYDQLDKTAAWLYATYVLGYSRQEAVNLFGLSVIPMEYHYDDGGITVVTDFKDEPQRVNLRFPNDNMGLREWRINAKGNSAIEFTFSGCFRTSTISGGEVGTWGNGYPVVCQYFMDSRSGYYVANANEKLLTVGNDKNVRRPLWFGYNSNGNWAFLGIAKEWDVDLAQIPNRGVSTINPTVMVQKFGISPQSLPENWSTFTGQEFVDAFLKELDTSK